MSTSCTRVSVFLAKLNSLCASRVFHMMGPGDETRHIVMANEQAIISPMWSIHSGCGTKAYSFCWGMGGENQRFDDMDHIQIGDLK